MSQGRNLSSVNEVALMQMFSICYAAKRIAVFHFCAAINDVVSCRPGSSMLCAVSSRPV